MPSTQEPIAPLLPLSFTLPTAAMTREQAFRLAGWMSLTGPKQSANVAAQIA